MPRRRSAPGRRDDSVHRAMGHPKELLRIIGALLVEGLAGLAEPLIDVLAEGSHSAPGCLLAAPAPGLVHRGDLAPRQGLVPPGRGGVCAALRGRGRLSEDAGDEQVLQAAEPHPRLVATIAAGAAMSAGAGPPRPPARLLGGER